MDATKFDSYGHLNTEMFHCETLAELNDETDGGLKAGDVITRGVQKSATATDLLSASDIIDSMSERAYEFCGEAAELGVDVTDEGEADLKLLLDGWFNKHVSTSFYAVIEQEKYTVTQEDVDALRSRPSK